MASISNEFSRECFDFDRLSASCLIGLVLKQEQKEAVSHSLEDFQSCIGSGSTLRCLVKRSATRIQGRT